MKRLILYVSLASLSLTSSTSALGYIGKSIRIMGMGDHLAGIVKDQDTDIYRNPAYLSFLEGARMFGQDNLIDHTELRIAEGFTNKGTGLLGLVLPLSTQGNLALVGELKPSTNRYHQRSASRSDYPTWYSISSSCGKEFSKTTIRNFKAVYSRQISDVIRLGADFVYLKNYNRRDSENLTITTEYDSFSDEVTSRWTIEQSRNSDDSPDAQRGSLGLVLTSWPKTTIDFTLYYENLSYTNTTSLLRGWEEKGYNIETTESRHYDWRTSTTPVDNGAFGLDVNAKHDLPQNTGLALLLGLRYEKNEFSLSDRTADSAFSDPYYSSQANSEIASQQDDRAFCLDLGAGVEKDFSRSIKLAAACKGYWERARLDHRLQKQSSRTSFVDDSLTSISSSFEEMQVKKTANSYEIAFPIGAEIVLHRMIKVRFGGVYVVRRNENESGYSTSSYDQYYQGIGLSYDERIFMDAYIEDEIDRLGNWMVKVEYRF